MRQQNQRDRQNGIDQARPKDRHQNQRQQQRRECQDNVHDAHEHRIDAATKIAGDKANRDAEAHRNDDDDEADKQRILRAVDQAGKNVPPNFVSTEKKLRRATIFPERRSL